MNSTWFNGILDPWFWGSLISSLKSTLFIGLVLFDFWWYGWAQRGTIYWNLEFSFHKHWKYNQMHLYQFKQIANSLLVSKYLMNINFFLLYGKKSTFLLYRIKKQHSTLEMDTFPPDFKDPKWSHGFITYGRFCTN